MVMKKRWGKEFNETKISIEQLYIDAEVKLRKKEISEVIHDDLPGYFNEMGSRHPISAALEEMTAILNV